MKTQIRILGIILLIINSAGAFYGGGSLMLVPSGKQLQLSESLLQHSPFESYFIPGMILFVFIGMFSLVALILTIIRHRFYSRFMLYQGVILAIWLLVQMKMIRVVSMWHYIMGLVALLLIACAWILGGTNFQTKERKQQSK